MEVEEAIIDLIRTRRDVGRKKYGVSMERGDLSLSEWITHAIEESLDFAVYLERVKRDVAASEAKIATMDAEIAELRAKLSAIQKAMGHPTTETLTLTREQLKVARTTPYKKHRTEWTVFDVIQARETDMACCVRNLSGKDCDCIEEARHRNGTGCSICSNPKCDDPCGKH